jgi:asparagine synthase (glutamine-hydrolysing)
MCGIAGVVDLTSQRAVPADAVRAMALAIIHRGPDEDGFLDVPGMLLASRRLSIVGLADDKQPISNENGQVGVVFNGELFDYPERKAELQGRGHHFRTHCDTELVPHLWEDHAEGMFAHLHGQFAFALWDSNARRLILARDRVGICPLFWTRQGDWLLFASEIKGLLASGMVEARPDPRGINTVFTFFALPGPTTCFAGVNCLLPGHYLDIRFSSDGTPATITDRTYWEIDFPDAGQEDPGENHKKVIDDFERVMLQSVERRLRADVPVVSYLSGGVDSSLVVALAGKVRGSPIPTFTIQVKTPRFDETNEALKVARYVGASPVVVPCGSDEVRNTYPALIRAAETPVIDTSCAALLMLAKEVHRQGYKVALTGEGADEWLAGYPWYQIHKLVGFTDVIPGFQGWLRRTFPRLIGAPQFPQEHLHRLEEAVGGPNPWLDVYGLMSLSKLHFFTAEMQALALRENPYEDLGLNLNRARRWHPLNRGLYIGARVMLAGLLLSSKGDRVAMNSSVETRYPFLDEDVFSFLANLHPRWKLRGFREKYVLRPLAERWLPKEIAWRRKAMFRAPFDSFHEDRLPPYVDQLLSPESLRKSGYFDPEKVVRWRSDFKRLRRRSYLRTSVEMGLVGVFATQLWHHTYIEPLASDLPTDPSQFRPVQSPAEKKLAMGVGDGL